MSNNNHIFQNSDFIKSSFSGVTRNLCVEVAIKSQGIGVRDSKDPKGKILSFDKDEWSAFIAGVKAGEFDI